MRNATFNVLAADDSINEPGTTIDTNQTVSASFHAVFGDNTAAGTFKVQVSNDINHDGYQPRTFTVTNWVDLPTASVTVAAGAPAVISVPQMCYRWARVKWVRTSGGSSTISVNANILSI